MSRYDEHAEEHETLEAGGADEIEDRPVETDVMAVARDGLGRRPGPGKKVLVVGGGMAGLVAAYELARAGHDPVVFEAQNRVGGRIYTCRDFAPGLYAEFGAMRLPRAHELTLAYCEALGLELRPFVMGNPRGLVYVGGERMTMAEADADPSRLPFDLAETERGRRAEELWGEAIADIRELVEKEGDAAWEKIRADYDRFSLYDFLRARGFSEGAIEYYAVMNFVEADLHNAVVEVLREELGGAYVDMQEVVGGMDLLPNGLYERIENRVRFGAEVHAIEQDDREVTVYVKTESSRYAETGDAAIITIPFPVLRSVEAITPFSREKQRAIRQLNYHASTKVLFQVRERVWETDDGIEAGASVTDLSVRRLNYPTPDPTTRRGILLASYTWGQDALQWGAMDEETRLEEALDDVARIHPRIRGVYEIGASHAWYGDRWARGAFALFQPEQQTRLQEAIVRPEGRIHFAGEHCSLYHAWIQGALESGIRAARAIHVSP